MPSEQQKSANSNLTTQPEKPFHYTYLKEFRTQQCQDFLQHKCPNHRPFTCFHWHFMNQRRRRPIRRRDGIFNYSPDVYCTKYDETTGICPDGEDCAYLHRTTGDTERRYHLRYYKTGTCVHETDARGHCVKNGPHCAFAHGPHDLRQPVYDVREMMAQQDMQQQQPPMPSESPSTNGSSLSQSLSIPDKDKIVQVDDPKWQDTNHVLAFYKTEPCKKPPRLCRQGYACPHYHNARDRRRSPKKLRCYRSTPCPNVKHGDEWGEISNCDQGDNCLYCHTRTEQQFHPEIYKSTKCNDMQQTGYCPRGPFCAFAHVDQEMSNAKNILEELNAPEVTLPSKLSLFHASTSGLQTMPSNMVVTSNGGSSGPNNLGPIGKPRSNSQSSNYSSESGSYQKAPGSEREDTLSNLKKLLQNVDNDVTIDMQEKNRRKQNLLLSHNISPSSPFASSISNCGLPSPGTPSPSSMSVNATPFYPPSDTVGSVVGNALDGISIEDVTNIDRDLICDNDGSSVGSSSASLGHLSLLSSTAPVNIPMSASLNQTSSISESPGSPLNSLPPAFIPQHIQQQQQIEMAAKNAFFSQPNPLPSLHKLGMMDSIGTSCSPSRGPQSPLLTTMASGNTCLSNAEVQRLQDEVIILKNKLQSWEESWNQAKQACDAWKKEASDSNEKAKAVDLEKQALVQAKEEAKEEAKVLKLEIEGLSGGPHLHVLNRTSELNDLPLHQLKKLQLQLKSDLDKLEKVIHIREGSCCYGCQDKARNVVVSPCYHLVFCDLCAPNKSTCSICHGHVVQRITIHL